ncbi:MAG: hypothetical protein HY553_20085 [Elusimicrobia bacterium]|nr:hypothetical protein [Elusimicrobiota bacterium]
MPEIRRKPLTRGLALWLLPLLALAVAADRRAGAGTLSGTDGGIQAVNCGAVAPTITFERSTINLGESTRVKWSSPAGRRVGGNITVDRDTWQTISPGSCGGHTYTVELANEPSCPGDEVRESGSATLTVTSPVPSPWVSLNTSSIYVGDGAYLSWGSNSGGNPSGGSFTSLSGGGWQYPGAGSHSWTHRLVSACTGEARSASASLSVDYPPPPPSMDCFATGTKITMADGTTKNVEDLKVGDMVRSYDYATGKYVNVAVTEASTKEGGDYVKINGNKGVTVGHKFYVNGQWKTAGELKVGDELIGANGEVIKITSIEAKPGPITVHPIRVAYPPGTFLAGEPPVVTHNKNEDSFQPGEGLVTGTLITMADGKRIPIEKVKPGDKILAVDPATGMLRGFAVKAKGKPETVAKFTLINGNLGIGPNTRMLQPKKGAKKGK